MNINKLVERVTQREGGKVNLNVAQIKEVISCLNTQLLNDTNGGINLYSLIHAIKEPGE